MSKKQFAVLGSYEDTGQIFRHDVEADDAFNAFGIVAAEHPTAVFIAAVELPAEIEFPGESVVYADTVREQSDVFPV